MAKRRSIVILASAVILIAAIIFAVTRFLSSAAAGIDNLPEAEVSGDRNVLTDDAFSISGNSVADSEKEIRDWADSIQNK